MSESSWRFESSSRQNRASHLRSGERHLDDRPSQEPKYTLTAVYEYERIGASMPKQPIRWLDKNLEPVLLVVSSIAMTAIVFIQVVMRYVFKSAFPWAEEIARYLFIWIIYLGISYSCRTRRHVRVTFVINRLNETPRRVIILFGDLLFFIYCLFIVIYGVRLNINTHKLQQYAMSIRLPLVFLYSSVVVGAFLSAVRLVQNMANKIRNWNAPMETFERLEAGDYLFRGRGDS